MKNHFLLNLVFCLSLISTAFAQVPVKQWDLTLGGNQADVLSSVSQTPDGGYIAGGSSASGASGDVTDNSKGDNDYWIVKINSAGVKQWDKLFGGNGNEGLRTVKQTSDGGYIIAGWSMSGISG